MNSPNGEFPGNRSTPYGPASVGISRDLRPEAEHITSQHTSAQRQRGVSPGRVATQPEPGADDNTGHNARSLASATALPASAGTARTTLLGPSWRAQPAFCAIIVVRNSWDCEKLSRVVSSDSRSHLALPHRPPAA